MRIHPGVGRVLSLLLSLCLITGLAAAQDVGSGTRNLHTVGRVSHELIPTPAEFSVIVLDQDPDRPFAYVGGRTGWSILDLSDPGRPTVLQTLPSESLVTDIAHFQVDQQALVAVAAGDEVDVFDVSGIGTGEMPVAIRSYPGGSSATLFAYRHSDGRALLIVSTGGDAVIYDAGGSADAGPAASIQTPEQVDPEARGFERAYAAYHADTETDRFYGAGAGGYHVFDITDTDSVRHVTSAIPTAVRRGHMVSATPDGRYLLAGAEYRAAPLRIFDLEPVFEGRLSLVRTSVGAWTHDWKSFLLAHELRWPLVFVAAGERGLQVFNMRDPEAPYTYAYLSTSAAPQGEIDDRVHDVNGAVDVDVRNSDGLIAVLDRQTGLWLVRLDAFQGWDGRGYGIPNISSVQDWTNGPDGMTIFYSP
ncbi:MAG TPA: hypothetical protein VMO47_08640 [Rhodothermales bacterium]|nr:hypothetical protein [Rhodothermales bacterium]